MSWVDGSPMDYTNWPSKAPDSKLLTADTCVTTRVVDGVWHLSQCTERLGFVCKTASSKLNLGLKLLKAEWIPCIELIQHIGNVLALSSCESPNVFPLTQLTMPLG